ncbi:hypothetical protein EDB82DRAFT_342215 [Fusarium venenatum]|uniref:uncharacterized protein n=1 Tax=Fusarium venenatum TaxID=56646 RepID=UPI001D303698|nr:hypothetical protein EDB82DRAFT_342215 [Fusarium venenatum]
MGFGGMRLWVLRLSIHLLWWTQIQTHIFYYYYYSLTLYVGGITLTLHRSLLNEAEILHNTLPSLYSAVHNYHGVCFRHIAGLSKFDTSGSIHFQAGPSIFSIVVMYGSMSMCQAFVNSTGVSASIYIFPQYFSPLLCARLYGRWGSVKTREKAASPKHGSLLQAGEIHIMVHYCLSLS